MVLGKLPGPIALAVCAGGGGLDLVGWLVVLGLTAL